MTNSTIVSTGVISSTACVTDTNIVSTQFTFSSMSTNYRTCNPVLNICLSSGKSIVQLDSDGQVVWHDDVDVDAAAQAFASSLMIGSELAAGIQRGTKMRMRDAVFEEIIQLAKSKGSLTAEDLTHLHQAAKIMDKLAGIK